MTLLDVKASYYTYVLELILREFPQIDMTPISMARIAISSESFLFVVYVSTIHFKGV